MIVDTDILMGNETICTFSTLIINIIIKAITIYTVTFFVEEDISFSNTLFTIQTIEINLTPSEIEIAMSTGNIEVIPWITFQTLGLIIRISLKTVICFFVAESIDQHITIIGTLISTENTTTIEIILYTIRIFITTDILIRLSLI